MRRFLFPLAALAAVAVLSGCGSSDDDQGASQGSATAKSFTIGVSNPIAANPAVNDWQKGIEVQAKSLGMKVVSADANLDPNKQLSDVQSLIDRKVDLLILSPLDPKSLQPAYDRAKAAGIPLIGWSGGAGPYATDIEATDYESGEEAAAYVAKVVRAGAKVGIIDGVPQIPIAKLRGDGFRAGAKKADLQIVASQVNTKDNADGARPIADGWRTKYGGDMKAIMSYNDPSALGAATVVQDGFKPVLTGVNASDEAIAAIKAGRLAATWDQRTIDVGNAVAWAAYQVLATKAKLPKTITAVMPRIDKSNVAEWKSPEQLLSGPETVSITQKDGKWLLTTTAPGS